MPANKAGLHEAACKYVEEEFKRVGGTPPVWIIGCGNSVAWMVTPWESGDEKQFTIDSMRELLAMTRAQCYATVSEAWMFTTDILPEDEKKHWTKHAAEHGLSRVPDKYKDDIVMINSFDRTENFLQSNYKVTIRQRGQGLSFLGPRMDTDYKGGFSGRMWNLLLPPREMEIPESMTE